VYIFSDPKFKKVKNAVSGMLHSVTVVRTDVSEERIFCIVRRFLVSSNFYPSSLIFIILMMEVIRSSETSVLSRSTRRNIREDGIPHSRRRGNLKSYIVLTAWTM
jgi:hypothetical protein